MAEFTATRGKNQPTLRWWRWW